MSRLRTAPEIATRLQVSPRTVLRLAKSGALASVRVGRAVRFTDDDVDAFLTARRSRPAVSPAALAVAALPPVDKRRFA